MPRYTHGQHATVTDSYRWRTAANSAAYALQEFTPGRTVLDLGCGPGTITTDLAARVAPARVTAVDADERALDLARATAAEAGAENIDFRTADALALDLPDDTYDIVHAHQVLQHLSDPVRALAEMRRVARPGGIVAACDSDYAGMHWYPLLPELQEWLDLYRRVARANDGEPDAGRRMLAWAHAAGFTDVTYTAEAWGHAAPERSAWWGRMWAERILSSDMGRQAAAEGFATEDDLKRISAGWHRFAEHPDAVFTIPRGTIVCRT